jgi:outer membrane protein
MTMNKWMTALLLFMVLMGCETYTQFRHTPAVVPSKKIPPEKGIDTRLPENSPVYRPTTQPTGVLTLKACIEAALARNGQIRIADRRILIARDRVLEAWSVDLPKINVDGKYEIQEKGVISTMVPAAGGGVRMNNVSLDRDVASYTASLIVPIYDFGVGYHLREGARIGVDVASLTSERVRQNLALNVAQAYFRILEAQKIKEVVLESIQTVDRQLKIAQDFLSQGLVAKNDVLVVEVRLAQRNQELIAAENNRQLAMATLNRLMDDPVTRELQIEDILEVAPWRGDFNMVFYLAIQNRPDLAALRQQIRIVEEQYRTSRASLMPKVSGYMNYTYVDSRNLTDKDTPVGGVMVHWSAFDGGLTYAQMARLSKEINEAIDNQSESEKDVILSVKQAYLNLNEAIERIPVAKKAVELAEENLRITRDQYAQGLLTSADVLQEEERLALARSSYYQQLYSYHQSFAILTNVIGTTPPATTTTQPTTRYAATLSPTTQPTQTTQSVGEKP